MSSVSNTVIIYITALCCAFGRGKIPIWDFIIRFPAAVSSEVSGCSHLYYRVFKTFMLNTLLFFFFLLSLAGVSVGF